MPGEIRDDLAICVTDFQDPSALPEGLSLRRLEVIEREAQVVETCFWRIRAGLRLTESDCEYVLKLLGRAAQLGYVHLAPDGDLLCSNGKSLGEQTADSFQLLGSMCKERLQALNWMCGQNPEYDEVTSDTIVYWLWDE